MKNLKYLTIVLFSIAFLSCDTKIIEVVDEFSFENGGYMRIVTPYPVVNGTFSVSKANLANTKMELVHEAVTPNKGSNFATYDLVIKFEDKTAANGNKSTTDKPLRVIAASEYKPDASTGYPRHTLTVTGTDALSKCGIVADDLAKGDWFTITGTMVLTDGKKFNAANTNGNILTGAFYSSPFSYRINVVD